jgi:hypothetical protein
MASGTPKKTPVVDVSPVEPSGSHLGKKIFAAWFSVCLFIGLIQIPLALSNAASSRMSPISLQEINWKSHRRPLIRRKITL